MLELGKKDQAAPNVVGLSLGLASLITYVSLSVVAVIVIIQTSISPYSAGTGDHLVISPAGLLRADGDLYLNDYFVRNAKMPHWFFEILTGVSARLGIIDGAYFSYWILGIAVFALANLLIADHLNLKFPMSWAFLLTIIHVLGPRVFIGTSAAVLDQALPHAMGGSLGFLVLVFLVRGDLGRLQYLLPVLPLVHVQIGAIILVLLLAWVVLSRLRREPIPATFIYFLLSSIGILLMCLRLRPIAGNIRQFSEICRDLIPHHCFSQSWTNNQLLLSALIIGLGFFAGLTSNKRRLKVSTNLVVFILPSLALAVGLLLDFGDIGVFADFVRGNNIYRFAVILVPFLYWSPFFIASRTKMTVGSFIAVVVGATLIGWILLLDEHGSSLAISRPLTLLVLSTVGLLILFSRLGSPRRTMHFLAASISLVPALGTLNWGFTTFDLPNRKFMPDEGYRSIGEVIGSVVPPGGVIAGDPYLTWMRMASERAYALDCKFRPIGGGQPLIEFRYRLEPLGGYVTACKGDGYVQATADVLSEYAQRGDANFLIVASGDARIPDLTTIGWKPVTDDRLASYGYQLLER